VRRRKLLLAALAVALVLTCFAAFVLWPWSRLTREKFDRIKQGMTAAEVEAILGPPTDDWSKPGRPPADELDAEAAVEQDFVRGFAPQTFHRWSGRSGILTVGFLHGKAVQKYWWPRATLFQRFQRQWRRWFP
jgi:hypothetical protein